MDTNFDNLRNLNREYLYTQLDDIKCNKKIYVVNDIISILSDTPSRDNSRVLKYPEEYVYVGYSKRGNSLRQVRLFTDSGLEYYLHDGNITNYIDACAYFEITPIDKELEKYKREYARIKSKCIDNAFKTSIMLSWIYDKRKHISKLPDYMTALDILEFVATHETVDSTNEKKLDLIKSQITYDNSLA